MEEEDALLWHAFDVLDDQKTGKVSKSKLKVLTQNLGNAYHVSDIENKFEEAISNDEISFECYVDFLKRELFENQSFNRNDRYSITEFQNSSHKRVVPNSGSHNVKINNICWMLCGKIYHEACCTLGKINDVQATVSANSAEMLWCVFCFASERDSNEKLILPVVIEKEEVEFIFDKYLNITGQSTQRIDFKQEFTENLDNSDKESSPYTFASFLKLFNTNCINGMDAVEVEAGVSELYDMFINDTLKKGILLKKGNAKPYTSWRERLFVLTPKKLQYFTIGAKRDLKGTILIEEDHVVKAHADAPASKQHVFCYTTSNRVYQMSASNLRVKNEWISAIKTSIQQCTRTTSYHRFACDQRRRIRHEKRFAREREEEKRLAENHQIQAKISNIEAENKEYTEAMARLKEEARLLDEEQLRLRNTAQENQQEMERRRKSRELAELNLKSEAERRLLELQMKLTSDIESEKLARLEIENKLDEEAALRKQEEERLSDLKEMNEKLQNLLTEEQLARKDEETVRALQSRLLEEQFEKREQLEALQQQLSEQVAAEKEKTSQLERDKFQTEAELQEAIRQQQELETERLSAETQIQDAMQKLHEAEKKRLDLETQIKKRSAPIGLARPLQPVARPLLTHRGEGAFPKEFIMPESKIEEQ